MLFTMEGESNLKKEWQAPEVVDLDVNGSESGSIYFKDEGLTGYGPKDS